MTRLWIHLIALILLSGCATGEWITYDHPAHEIAEDSRPVPLNILDGGNGTGSLSIPISFNGHIENCQVDTGASISVLYTNAFFDSLPTVGSLWTRGVAGKDVARSLKQVDALEIGGLLLKDARWLSMDVKHGNYPCLIGLDLLSSGVIAFDFKKKQFQLRKQIPPELNPSPLSISMTGGISVPFQIDGTWILTYLDSGAAATMVDTEFISQHPASFRFFGKTNQGSDIQGNALSFNLYRVKKATLGTSPIAAPFLTIGHSLNLFRNDHAIGLVGFNLIRRYNWMIDLKRKLWVMY